MCRAVNMKYRLKKERTGISMDFRELSKLAYDLRKDTVDMIVAGKGVHILTR